MFIILTNYKTRYRHKFGRHLQPAKEFLALLSGSFPLAYWPCKVKRNKAGKLAV